MPHPPVAATDRVTPRRGFVALTHDGVGVTRLGTRVRCAEIMEGQIDALPFISLFMEEDNLD